MRLRLALTVFMLVLVVVDAQANPAVSWVPSLKTLAYALAWIMMVIMGVKWIIADSPNERAEAKKGMMYVVIGLLIVASACQLLDLYCDNARQALGGDFTCDLSSFGC